MATHFADWLIQELVKRDWSQSDLSRNAKISTSQITRILNGQRNAGEDALKAIAHAFRLPPEQVFRAAGFLPPAPNINEDIEQILHEIEKLPKDDQREVLAFIRMKNNLRKKK